MITAIENVRVFNGTSVQGPQTVLFEGGTIVAGGTPGERVDGAGRTLLPGLIDAHMHVAGRSDLERLAHEGVTTGLDMAAWPMSLVNEMKAQRGVAQLRSAGVPAVGPGGNHAAMPSFPREGIVTTPDEARAFVERRVRDGVDYVKIVTEAAPPQGMDQATVNAIVTAAHEHGLLVVAHSITTGAFHVAIEAGVDISTHAPLDAVIDDESVSRMREAAMVCVPTLTMMQGVARLRADAGLRYEHARDSVRKFHEAGLRILVGTDANTSPEAPFAPAPGSSMHDEFILLTEAGLSPLEVLRDATSAPADVFGLPDRGVIAPGHRADLVLVDGDPSADVTASRRIAGVWIEGEGVR